MAVTNLTNTKWKWNDTISYSGTLDRIFTLNFTSNNTAYVNIGISYSSMSNIINYNKSGGLVTMAQSNNSWENEAYKEFEVSGGSDATNTDLINFITSNATQVMDNPVFKRVSGEWVKQNAYRFINGSWGEGK